MENETNNYDVDDYDAVVKVIEPKESKLDLNKPRDLLIFFAERYEVVHGFPYVISWEKEIAIFKAFLGRYKEDSGPMVKLLFDKHQGIIASNRMSATAFAVGSKWIQDILYSEVQDVKIEASKPPVDTKGLTSSNDFLERFSV